MKIADVIRFAHEHGNGNVYQGWSDEEIATHLTFHANGGTLMVTESDGKITSFSTHKQIKDFNGDIDTVFWNHTDREGRHVYIHELVSRDGVSASHMLDIFKQSTPNADKLTYWAHRKNKIRNYTYSQLRRFLCHHQRHHHRPITPPQIGRE